MHYASPLPFSNTLFQLDDTNAKVVFCVAETADLVKEAVSLCKNSRTIKVFSLDSGSSDWCEDARAAIEDCNPADCPDPYVPANPKEEVMIIFWSSGTTGKAQRSRLTKVCHGIFSILCRPSKGHMPYSLHGFQLWRLHQWYNHAQDQHGDHDLLLPCGRIFHWNLCHPTEAKVFSTMIRNLHGHKFCACVCFPSAYCILVSQHTKIHFSSGISTCLAPLSSWKCF